MQKYFKEDISAFLVFLLLSSVFAPLSTVMAQPRLIDATNIGDDNPDEAYGFPEALVEIDLRASDLNPRVKKKLDIVLTVKALKEYSDARLEIVLPKGVSLVKGDLTWEGSLRKGGKKKLRATVRTLKSGVFEILGKMIAFEGDADRIGKMSNLNLLVGEKALQQYMDAIAALTNPEQPAIQIEASASSGASVGPASPGYVTIKGWFGLYECRCDPTDDNDCACSPCTGGSCPSGSRHLHGLPYARIEAWDDDTVTPDDHIATIYTDINGQFTFTNLNNEDGEGGTNEWYLKFKDRGHPPFQTGYIWVQGMDSPKNPDLYAYWFKVNIGNIPDGTTHDVGGWGFSNHRLSNILYAVMKQCKWMYDHCYAWDMPNVVVYYPGDSSYTYPSLYEIYIAGPGKSPYDHAMDDDVVIHEYAHDVMYRYYGTMPRSSCTETGVIEGCTGTCYCTNHGGSGNDCSCDGISEGWANFAAALVPEEFDSRNWATDRYVVTKDGLVYRDHESNAYKHEYHEMTFARILWDLLDPIVDGEDVQVPFYKGATWSDYDTNPIWFEMTRQAAGNEHSMYEEPYTLVEFWIFWLETFPYGETTTGESDLCDIYSLHWVKRDFTNRCTNNCKCDGSCEACCDCGGSGCTISNYSCGCDGVTGTCKTYGCGGAGCITSLCGTVCSQVPTTSWPCYGYWCTRILTTGLPSTYPATVFLEGRRVGKVHDKAPWEGKVAKAKPGPTLSVSRSVAVSSTERYYTPDTISWSVTSSEEHKVRYYLQYLLNIMVSPAGGGTTDPPPGSYWRNAGTTVDVTETPATGYEFDHWDLDGSNVGTGTSYTVTMDAPHNLTAVFKIMMCEVTFETRPSTVGSITFQGKTYTSGQKDTFPYNTSGPATANATAGWVFSHWENTINIKRSPDPYDNPTDVTIKCGGILRAVFMQPSEVVITSFYVTPKYFSPNGDGKKDTTMISAMFTTEPDAQPIPTTEVSWILRVKNTVTDTVMIWTGRGGRVDVVWDGSGQPDGEYGILLHGYEGGNMVEMQSRTVVIDTTEPDIKDISDEPDPWNPIKGPLTISYTLSERCHVTIRFSDVTITATVGILTATQPAGPNKMFWDGKLQGTYVPEGTYQYIIHLVDMAGNERVVIGGTVKVTYT